MGKLTIFMAIFNSYVSLPEGTTPNGGYTLWEGHGFRLDVVSPTFWRDVSPSQNMMVTLHA